jgi:hypothetical protein
LDFAPMKAIASQTSGQTLGQIGCWSGGIGIQASSFSVTGSSEVEAM